MSIFDESSFTKMGGIDINAPNDFDIKKAIEAIENKDSFLHGIKIIESHLVPSDEIWVFVGKDKYKKFRITNSPPEPTKPNEEQP